MKLRRPSPFIGTVIVLLILLAGGFVSIQEHLLAKRTDPETTAMTATELTDTTPVSSPTPDSAHDAEGARALSELAVSLLQHDAAVIDGENALVSPLSVANALGLAANGAKGATLAQMEQVLELDVVSLNEYLATQRLHGPADGTESEPSVSLSNSIWIRDTPDFEANEAFLQTAASWYDASVFSAPFDATTIKDINAWVEDGTDGMIDEMLPVDQEIPERAMLYLVNALAFEGAWKDPVDDAFVETASFTREDGLIEDAELMFCLEDRYLELDASSGAAATDEATSAAIPDAQRLTGFMKPYQGGTYAFVALLPPEGMTVEQTLGCLDGDVLAELLDNPWYNPVGAYLPKFSYDTEMELVDTLGSLGMADALDPDRADFSGMGSGVSLYISRVLHKTHIEVDQEGTSAAAATAVEMEAGSSAPGEPLDPKTVRLDRPFIYLIVDTTTNTPLFLGTYMGT